MTARAFLCCLEGSFFNMALALLAALACGATEVQAATEIVQRRDGAALEQMFTAAQAEETPAQRETRIAWWREARFGMFVHWGAYSYLGGTWHGQNFGGYAEHIQRAQKIPMAVYRTEVVEKFNPTNFNAAAWAHMAKQAGMGYLIITAKHHDGFAMFDSKVSDYNIVKVTPFARDPMKELAAACKKEGIKFGFYYSHAFDWGEENAPGNDWDWLNPGGDKLLHGADWWVTYPEFLSKARKYVDAKAIPQLLELIRNYQPDILWFDTPHKLPPEENFRIFEAVRQADPMIVINGRIFSGRGSSFGKLTDYRNTADKPDEFPPQDDDWEGVPTTNESYGYNEGDHSHKSPGHFIRLLVKSVARGGNMLMNIGPRGDGTVDPTDVNILNNIGAWWAVNGQSIRGAARTPLAVQAWGESTRKGNTIYLHVFEWPRDGKLVVGGLKTDVTQVWLIADKAKAVANKLKVVRLNPADLQIEGLPKAAPDENDSVIALACVGTPQADTSRLISTTVQTNVLRSFDAKYAGKLQFGPGKAKDAWVKNWTSKKEAVIWPVRVNEKATFAATLVYDAPNDSERNRMVEGDAGKELLRANQGAGGSYLITLGEQNFTNSVRQGIKVRQELGKVSLKPGNYNFKVVAQKITGEELFRLRQLELKPVAD